MESIRLSQVRIFNHDRLHDDRVTKPLGMLCVLYVLTCILNESLSLGYPNSYITAWTVSIIGFVSMCSTIFVGWLQTRVKPKYILGGIYLLRAIIMAVFVWTPLSLATTFVFAAIMGVRIVALVDCTLRGTMALDGPRNDHPDRLRLWTQIPRHAIVHHICGPPDRCLLRRVFGRRRVRLAARVQPYVVLVAGAGITRRWSQPYRGRSDEEKVIVGYISVLAITALRCLGHCPVGSL
ncbi:hypothetical protein BC937DRAFT_93624, partial [Endogone sp. FLAS-F59071]